MVSLSFSADAPAALDADALVFALSGAADDLTLHGPASALDAATGGALLGALRAVRAQAKVGTVTTLPPLPGIGAARLLAVGVGAETGLESLRRAAGAGVRAAGAGRVVVALAGDDAEADAVAEGALLGAYQFDTYRSEPRPASSEVVVTGSAGSEARIHRATVVTEAIAWTRDHVNTPPGDLWPAMLAENAAALAGAHGIEVEILDEVALKAAAFGGILGVGAGSVRPPRLVRLAWRHPDATRTIAFVGKGITFDSGGLSIKPAKAMEWMKADMAGAAAVIAAVSAIARLNLPINITAWAPLAENMPSGTATRPGDVLRMYGGKTVEVLNTDAEGRLVLGDALVRAGEEKPDAIVDVATLTGAQLVALGARVSAIMTNDDDFGAEVRRAADDAGEAMWPMPLPPELRASMDTDIADIANIGDRSGGMLVAGLFLAEFVPAGTPWVHLDIAGPSYNDGKPYGYTPSGGTGVAVRTLVRLAELSAT
ncbi:MAG: leucyl aminopeptidase [Frankiaceae bacterium]|jgi:leucyl aminopeptidase|nr:leucyl aminopeptidase [Frankiaceae bacterium]